MTQTAFLLIVVGCSMIMVAACFESKYLKSIPLYKGILYGIVLCSLFTTIVLGLFGCAGRKTTREDAHRWCVSYGLDPRIHRTRGQTYSETYSECMERLGFK